LIIWWRCVFRVPGVPIYDARTVRLMNVPEGMDPWPDFANPVGEVYAPGGLAIIRNVEHAGRRSMREPNHPLMISQCRDLIV
jgi:hypothetical protein